MSYDILMPEEMLKSFTTMHNPGQGTDSMSSETMKSKNSSIFISYAQADEHLLKRLQTHLFPLQKQHLAPSFVRNIDANRNWEHEIDGTMDMADIILLLISANFMASDYCYSTEIERVLKRHESGEARVIPIILRPTLWQGSPFGKLQVLPTNAKPVVSWRDQDQAFKDIVQGIQKTIKEIQLRDSFHGIFSSPQTTIWHVPYQRNPGFTGREDLLLHIHEQLAKTQTVALTQPQGIYGLGGIGKTQTALEYAYRYRAEYRYGLWIQTATSDALNVDFAMLPRLLLLPEKDQQNQRITVEAVKHWLEEHDRWLLIFDNADDLSLVYDFLPIGDTGHILLTTRAQAIGAKANRIEIPPMTLEESIHFLEKRTAIPVNAASLIDAQTLIKDLDGLPLALDLAASFIRETRCDISEYLRFFRSHRRDILMYRMSHASDASVIANTTSLLTFQKVEEENETAAELLRLCAFLAPDVILEEIIIKSMHELEKMSSLAVSDPLLLNNALETLHKYSLLRRNTETKTVSIHRLVQAVLLDTFVPMAQQQYAECVIRTISVTLSTSSNKNETFYQNYLSHAYRCRELILSYGFVFPEAANLLYEVGKYLYDHSSYKEAEPFFLEALHMYEAIQGIEQKEIIKVLGALAQLYLGTGEYEKAEVLLQRILFIASKIVNFSELELASTYSSLAQVYQKQGRYEEAQIFYLRALDIQKNHLGLDHLSVAQSLHTMATLYQNQERYSEAEALYLEALAIREKQLGSEDVAIAESLNNLGILYQNQGKYQKAELMYSRALAIREKHFGPEHPDTAESLNNLAVLYDVQGELGRAEFLYQRALSIYERVLGPDHPYTAHNLRNLAGLYQNQGRFEQAESLYQRAAAILESDSILPE